MRELLGINICTNYAETRSSLNNEQIPDQDSNPGHSAYKYHKNLLFASRTSELVALMAISTTLFLFIHTRELHTKLKAMEVKLQPEEMLSGKCFRLSQPSDRTVSLCRITSVRLFIYHSRKCVLPNAAHRIPDDILQS